METKLLIYEELRGEDLIIPFPNSEKQASIYTFDYECKRMGSAPTITASFMYEQCLDSLWNDNVFVEFNGERYFAMRIPSSSYSNESVMYKHDITFISERKFLETTYFKDGVLTTFQFFGDLNMFAERMNDFLEDSGLGYSCVVDDGIETDELLISIDEMYVKASLDYAFERYDVTYYFIGKEIHFGYYENEVQDTFSYGFDNELISVKRENNTEKFINRISGCGSSENIPYYYPNFNQSGEHEISTTPQSLAGYVEINYAKLDQYTNLRDGGTVTFREKSGADIDYSIDNEHDFVSYINGYPASNSYKYVGTKDEFANLHGTSATFRAIYYLMFRCGFEGNVRFDLNGNKTYIDEFQITSFSLLGSVLSREIHLINRDTMTEVQTTVQNGIVTAHIGVGNYMLSVDENLRWEDLDEDIEHSELKVFYSYDCGVSFNSEKGLDCTFNGFLTEHIHSNEYSFTRDIHQSITSDISCVAVIRMKFDVQKYTNVHFGTRLQAKWIPLQQWNYFDSSLITIKDHNDNYIDFTLSDNGYVSFRSGSQFETYEAEIRIPVSMQLTRMFYNGVTQLIPSDGVSFRYTSNISRVGIPYNHVTFDDNGRIVKPRVAGIYFDDESSVSDGSTIVFSETQNWIAPMPNLMPTIYRESLGNERFYDAVNDTYYDIDDEFYEFPNQIDENPNEHIEKNDDIKPTIVGVENANGELIGVFKEFAYDENDNNEWETDGDGQVLKHSYFFGKLRKFDGQNGFNLFQQAIESGEMTITMTSGSCGSCDFVIGVNDDGENTVQVDDDGNLVRNSNGDVVFGSPQQRQQDTINYEVWVALKKDENSYGVILPDLNGNIAPAANTDTFVITNILLPNAYIVNAERKLELFLLDYMLERNDDKFNYGIDFSRIFMALNEHILETLNENSLIHVEYDDIVNDLYVSSFKYSVNGDEPLPKVSVQLERKLTKRDTILERIAKSERNVVSQYINNISNSTNISYSSQVGLKSIELTLDEYMAMPSHDKTTLYFITDKGYFYKGDNVFVGIKDCTIHNDENNGSGSVLTFIDSLGFEHDFYDTNYYHEATYNNGVKVATGVGVNDINVPFMEGATSNSGGRGGLVPTPQSGQGNFFLRGDGQWVEIESGGSQYPMFIEWEMQSDFTITTTNEVAIGTFTLGSGLWHITSKVQLRSGFAGDTRLYISSGNKDFKIQSMVTCPRSTTPSKANYEYFAVPLSGFLRLDGVTSLSLMVRVSYIGFNGNYDSVIAHADSGISGGTTNLIAVKIG